MSGGVLTPIVVLGASGQGRETAALIESINGIEPTWQLLGILDDAPSVQNAQHATQQGLTILGTTDWLHDAPPDVVYAMGIADCGLKRQFDERLGGRRAATLVHPTAHLGPCVELGPGSVIGPGCTLTTNIRLGRHVQVNPGCAIGHDSNLGSYTTVNPLAAISGNVTVGEGVLIGTHACVLQGLQVGDGAVVGAAACVVRPVPAGRTVKGVPAR